MHSTLPRSKKEISHPSLSGDDIYTTKHFEINSKPATDHESFRDEVQYVCLFYYALITLCDICKWINIIFNLKLLCIVAGNMENRIIVAVW